MTTSQLSQSRSVLINQSYQMQRITGQQRYATEIAERLAETGGFAPIAPTGFWARSTLRVWLWLQVVLPVRARSATVLSMTSRAPMWRRRHVLVVHDLFVLTNPEWFSRRYVWTHAPLLRAQIRSAAAIVAVSQPVADQLAEYYRGPVVVAPNAPSDIFVTKPDPCADRDALAGRGLTAGEYFLTVGSMDPRKNLPVLARAYAALSEHERAAHPLVIVGGGSDVFRSESISWPAGTIDAGYVTDAELRALYSGARAVVFVSYAEGFGLPLVESAAAGAQGLVISDIPVFRWICGDGAHYVDPSSVPSITGGLRAAIRNPRPHHIDLDRFSWDASANIVGQVCELVEASA